MALNKVDLIKAKLDGIRDAIKQTPEKDKGSAISIALANNFNAIVQEVATEFPDLASHLPKPIQATTHFKMMSKADDTYRDLHAYVEQVYRLLAVVESGR